MNIINKKQFTTVHLHENHEALTVDLPAGPVALIGDIGQFLSICTNCGQGAYADSAAFSPTLQNWTLEVHGSQVAFKGSHGKYLTRCRNCWTKGYYPDSVFVHVTEIGPWALWTPIIHPSGKYSFRSDIGTYLTRCNSCVIGNPRLDFVFVNEANPAQVWAQWDVIYTNLPKLGVRTFQGDTGGYLKYCPTCGVENAVSISAGLDDNAKWTLSRVGTKLAIKGANGKFLSRCHNCWPGGAYPESAFANAADYSQAYSQWAPTKQANGNWVFQADTGNYLTRCQNCAKSSELNLAFVHVSDPSGAWAQFKLV